ncbi:ER membrane protein complex subunit 8/9 homolog isoform X2 [Dendrobium catenatum]|uniref:ER membrane protein complex subunit 8/9 homolog isoform X2 n=1 Tax=Dendrobium catenatum TaxID=906689 RepID=UPI00109EF1E8|nr:ER membrane protein complex subunit 8/9 homolog isoform X2 [Dendrobium catenatum]
MGDCRYQISQCAYIKFVLHALKHRSSSVNGLLLGRLLEDGGGGAAPTVLISDSVPLSHSQIGVLPYLELALIQVEEHFASDGLTIVGYYHANERYDDTELSGAAKKIGDHIFRYFPQAALLLLFTRDSSRSWRSTGSVGSPQLTTKEPSANVVLLDFMSTEKWNEVVDFDDHLDDISKDWLNPDLFK